MTNLHFFIKHRCVAFFFFDREIDFMIGNFHWYVFNLADSYVTVGMVLVLVDSIILEKKRESAHS